MPENRIRLGPFALKLLAEHGPKGSTPDGKALDDLLHKAFAEGRALEPQLARNVHDSLAELPDWDAYKDQIVALVYSGVDGIGNESIEAFDKLNGRITQLERNLNLVLKNQTVLDNKLNELLKLNRPAPDVPDDVIPF